MSKGGYISLHRQILDWEWFRDTNTLALFIYLLLSANYTDSRFMGKKIRRGQVVTSLGTMAEKTGLSIQNVKTSLKHLILTGEITNESNRKCRIITIVKYDEYQKVTNDLTEELTSNQQTTNKQLTNSQQHHNKNNKNNKGINNNTLTGVGPRAQRFVPPTVEEVVAFCEEAGITIDAERFVGYYESIGWKVGRNPMKDWKAAARSWAQRDRKDSGTKTAADTGGYHQRDYSSEQEEAFRRMMEAEA